MSLDAMGGDFGPSVVVPAALSALAEYNDLHLTLVGRAEALENELSRRRARVSDRLMIRHATEVVAMDESRPRRYAARKTPPCAWPSIW